MNVVIPRPSPDGEHAPGVGKVKIRLQFSSLGHLKFISC